MNQRTRIQIISFGNLLTVPILYVVALLMSRSDRFRALNPNPKTETIFLTAFAIISFLTLVGAFFINKLVSKEIQDSGEFSQKGISLTIVVLSLCEVPAILGFILFLMIGDMNYFYAFGIFSLILFGIFWRR